MAMEILAWVHLARRPLSVTELAHAVAIEIGSDEFDPEDLPPRDFTSSCLGLIRVSQDAHIVTLVHKSLGDYFGSRKTLQRFHRELSQKCLTCLRFPSAANKTTENLKDVKRSIGYGQWSEYHAINRRENHPFLTYASTSWGLHLRMVDFIDRETMELAMDYVFLSDESLLASVFEFALSFCHRLPDHSWPTISLGCPRCRLITEFKPWKNPRPHILAFFGLCDVWSEAQEKADDGREWPEAVDGAGYSPLFYAALGGHVEMVELLLAKHHVNVDFGGINGMTPLIAASMAGQIDTVVTLARLGADLNAQTDLISPSRTPLTALTASLRCYELDVLIFLLEQPTLKVNQTCQYREQDWTALGLAAKTGREAAVELLLRHPHIMINSQRTPGRDFVSPLAAAIERGNTLVVSALLATTAPTSTVSASSQLSTQEWMSSSRTYLRRSRHLR